MAQVHFVPVWTGNGHDHMNYYITTATIDDQNMQAGDEIGIFDGTHCVGAGILTGEIIEGVNYLALVASKNDALPPEVNGYIPGNTVGIKLWDDSEQLEITSVEVTYISGTDIFSIGGTSSLKAEGNSAAPQSPVADAGEDQQVSEGDSVTLDGSGSYDPSSGTLSYKWTADSAIVLNDSSSLTPAFIAPEVEQDSFFRFFLVVTNGSIDSEPDTVVITVLDVNKIPVITGQLQISTDEEVPVTLSVTDLVIEDPDNSFPDDFTLIVGDGDHFTISELEVTPELDFTGTLEIQVTVNDGRDESEPYPLAVTVYNVNDPPYFTLFPADTTIDKNSSTLLNIKATDADPGDMLSISVSFDPGISQYDITETGNGEAELTVVPGTGDHPVTVNVTLTDNIIAMPVEQIFTIGFSPTGLEVPGSTDPVSVCFDQAAGRYYLRNNLSQQIKIEFIRITGSIILKTVLHSGQEAGISLPGDPHGIYLLRFTGTSVSGTRKVLLE